MFAHGPTRKFLPCNCMHSCEVGDMARTVSCLDACIYLQTGKGAPRNGTDDTPPTDTIPMLLEVPKIQVSQFATSFENDF
jgi:hypothetical protein